MAAAPQPIYRHGSAVITAHDPNAVELAVNGLVRDDRPSGGNLLQDASLTVSRGERVALLGAGSATLVRCCLRLVEPCAGTIQLFGNDIMALPQGALRRLRARTGLIGPQTDPVAPVSVLAHMLGGAVGGTRPPGDWYQATSARLTRAEALRHLREVGLAGQAGRRSDRLSPGQARRLAVARVLMRQPRLVMAADATAGLAPEDGEAVLALLARVTREHGMTLVFSSRSRSQAERHAQRVIAVPPAPGRRQQRPGCRPWPQATRGLV